MEDVLDLYCLPYDPKRPVVNMDEQPVQLTKETRTPQPMQPGHPARYDYEYERNGTASIFLFSEALQRWRKTSERERRTRQDWAQEVKTLLEVEYPNAEKVILICDNLNTHDVASLYETFPPEIARALARRLEIHYTPKHGSWLNIAECELSALTRQCLNGRTTDRQTLKKKLIAWNRERNAKQKGVDWRFTTSNARIKLKRLYPQIKA
jgi:hypothetical protein